MKEKIARALSVEDGWIWEDLNDNYWSGYFRRADLVITLIREKIEKELLTDEEINIEAKARERRYWLEYGRDIAQAQLDKVLKALES